MILDAQGNRINNTAAARAVVLVSHDDGSTWHPEKSYNVPDEVKDKDVMGRLLSDPSFAVQIDDGPLYRAERVQ
jgi:hypothetical protein